MIDRLLDQRLTVPTPSGDSTLREAQRRMARWLDGPLHELARRHAVDALATIDPARLRLRAEQVSRALLAASPNVAVARVVPVAVLAEALGFDDPMRCSDRQPAITAAFLRLSDPVPLGVDRLLADQLSASGRGDPDEAANVVALLHQCLGATAALIEGVHPPVPSTVRISQTGERIEIPLGPAPFGLGAHACPAQPYATALASGVRSALIPTSP